MNIASPSFIRLAISIALTGLMPSLINLLTICALSRVLIIPAKTELVEWRNTSHPSQFSAFSFPKGVGLGRGENYK